MPIHLIYARSEDFCIGRGGGLPWRLPDDFRHFKQTTLGHPVLMGRATYADHESVLPDRTNVVLSRDPGFRGVDGIVVRHDLDAAMDEFCADGQLAFVIGGAGVFSAAFPRADEVIETVVDDPRARRRRLRRGLRLLRLAQRADPREGAGRAARAWLRGLAAKPSGLVIDRWESAAPSRSEPGPRRGPADAGPPHAA